MNDTNHADTEHRAIFGAITARNGEATADLTGRHIRSAFTALPTLSQRHTDPHD